MNKVVCIYKKVLLIYRYTLLDFIRSSEKKIIFFVRSEKNIFSVLDL